jgi:hypothetical protein
MCYQINALIVHIKHLRPTQTSPNICRIRSLIGIIHKVFVKLMVYTHQPARVVGYGLFFLCLIYKEGLCPSVRDIYRFLVMMMNGFALRNINALIRKKQPNNIPLFQRYFNIPSQDWIINHDFN